MNQATDSSEEEIQSLSLSRLKEGTPGITAAVGEALSQAAAVCLEDQEHSSGAALKVDGDFKKTFTLLWDNPTGQMLRCWRDEEVATEHGACGIAALLVLNLTDLTVVERSYKGTGFDYWLGSEDDDPLFQGKSRLEVSGIRKGSDSTIRSRVKQKIEQIRPSDGALPAMVIIVEFGTPCSRVVNK